MFVIHFMTYDFRSINGDGFFSFMADFFAAKHLPNEENVTNVL